MNRVCRTTITVGVLLLLGVFYAFASQCQCLEYIKWDEAKDYIEEAHWVQGPVVDVGRDNKGDVFLNLGRPYPDLRRFTVVIWAKNVSHFSTIQGFPEALLNKTIRVFGTIESYKGTAEIKLSDPKRLIVENAVLELKPCCDACIEFWGAAGEVAGSCYRIKVGDESVLIDCGSFLAREGTPTAEKHQHKDADPFCFDPSGIDAILVTHAHDDHVGRIHYLVYHGFTGLIYMTEASAAIYEAKLDDTIDYCDAIPKSKHDAVKDQIRRSIRMVTYNNPLPITDHISATFVNAGHIPGSASIVLTTSINGINRTITFSGDIGSGHHPFLNGPDLDYLSTTDTDILVIESTYGASLPRHYSDEPYAELWRAIRETRDRGGLVIIPAFALDRTQRLLAAIREGMDHGELPPDLRVAIGGKSSCYLTRVYAQEFQAHRQKYAPFFSSSFWDNAPLGWTFWDYLRGSDCSNKSGDDISRARDYDVIIATSGTGGSSLSKKLLREFVNDPNATIVKVGWAPPDAPMGQIGKEPKIEIDSRFIPVHARFVDCSHIFSGHADSSMLLQFVEAFKNLEMVLITHGEDAIDARAALAHAINEQWPNVSVALPGFGDSVSLLQGASIGNEASLADVIATQIP